MLKPITMLIDIGLAVLVLCCFTLIASEETKVRKCEEVNVPVQYPCIQIDIDVILDAIQMIENPSKNPEIIGDQHLNNMAYGIYQIRQPLLDDLNRIVKDEHMQELWGTRILTLADVKDAKIARWCARAYLIHYGKVYQKKTGMLPCTSVYVRIYNGGPNGWAKKCTISYRNKVFALLYCPS